MMGLVMCDVCDVMGDVCVAVYDGPCDVCDVMCDVCVAVYDVPCDVCDV